jgi:hypothetical protein
MPPTKTTSRTPTRRWPLWRAACWAVVIPACLALGWHVPQLLLWLLAHWGLLPW